MLFWGGNRLNLCIQYDQTYVKNMYGKYLRKEIKI